MYLRDARHLDKFLYALGDDLFYEPLESHYEPLADYVSIITPLLTAHASGWVSTKDRLWFHIHPKQTNLPGQGWKLHVSATLNNSSTLLDIVARVALQRQVPFKFALDSQILSLMTSKRWDRGGSGKFITLYPADITVMKNVLEQLYSELRDQEGPYILSDKRYKDCKVLYYRYGGFRHETSLNVIGEHVSVLRSPDGQEVPDIRRPYFSPPPWADDPFGEHVQSGESGLTLNDGRYTIKEALSFSNSGGVYLAEDVTTGADVVIKEARLHTLQDGRGNDAITLLQKEHAILTLLSETGIAPAPIEVFFDWENCFLVEEYVAGVDIRELMLGSSPLMLVHPSSDNAADFYGIYQKLFTSFFNIVDILHEHGIVFGDLSANNLRIDPYTHAVRLIDFEGAFRVGVDTAPLLFTPGFRDPRTLKTPPGTLDDLYALAAIMLYAIFPIHALSSLRSNLYEGILEIVINDVGWAHTPAYEIISGLSKGVMSCKQAERLLNIPPQIVAPMTNETTTLDSNLCGIRANEIGKFLVANIRLGESTLFPADPFVERTNSLSLGFGACGVLYALQKCGIALPSHAIEWVARKLDALQPNDLAPALLTGSAGIAWILYDLGMEERAMQLLSSTNESPLLTAHHSYLYGMAGVGMANIYLYRRTLKQEYLMAAEYLAEQLLRTAHNGDNGLYWKSDDIVHIGYGYGQSGVALFFLRLGQLTGKEAYFSQGRQALAFDISCGVELETGVLSFPRAVGDFTLDPYLEEGSAGVARVALRYGMWNQLDQMLSDVHRKYASYSGLLYGLGGFVDVLTDAFIASGNPKYLEMVKRPLSGLQDIYLLEYPDGVATPGDGLLRVSCDYATGAAGVMRALHRHANFGHADFVLDELSAFAGEGGSPTHPPSSVNDQQWS
jgi:serine/threonine protein kinase